jgi:hypothetical protein
MHESSSAWVRRQGVAVGDKVEVAGVTEYFDFTEITDIVTLSSGNAQLTSTSITLSPDFSRPISNTTMAWRSR